MISRTLSVKQSPTLTLILWLIGLPLLDKNTRQYDFVNLLIKLGGVYVKFAQILLIKLDDGNLPINLRHIQKLAYEKVPLEYIDIQTFLQKELDANYHLLKSVNTQPFASGSFAQVYVGYLHDNSPVAIKILRPSVQNRLSSDLRTLSIMTLLFSPFVRSINLRKTFKQLRLSVASETDYVQELRNTQFFKQVYANNNQVHIPTVYKQLSTKKCLVTEYVAGLSLSSLMSIKTEGYDISDYVTSHLGSSIGFQLEITGKAILESFLENGVSHGDPNPGNIILLPNNKVAFIDFGSVATLSDRRAMYKLTEQYAAIYEGEFDLSAYLRALCELFARELTSSVDAIGRYSNRQLDSLMEDILAEVSKIINPNDKSQIEKLLQDQKFLQIFFKVINKNNRLGLTLELDDPNFLRSSLIYIYLLENLDLKREVLSRVYLDITHKYATSSFDSSQNRESEIEAALEYFGLWLDTISRRDTLLYLRISSVLNKRIPAYAI